MNDLHTIGESMSVNTRASATRPEQDDAPAPETTSLTTGQPDAASVRSQAASCPGFFHWQRGSTPARVGRSSTGAEEVSPTLLPPAVQDALNAALLGQPAVDVVVCDAEGIVTMMSSRLEQVAGQGPQPIHVDEWPRRCHLHGQRDDTPLERAENPLAIALSGKSVTDAPVAMRPPADRARFLRCTAAPLFGPNGETLGGLALLVDVTVQTTLQRTIEEMSLLFQTVNHEVRTPLACVVGHLELLADLAANLRGDARWSWEALVKGAARLQAAVDDITTQAGRAVVPQISGSSSKSLTRTAAGPAAAQSSEHWSRGESQ